MKLNWLFVRSSIILVIVVLLTGCIEQRNSHTSSLSSIFIFYDDYQLTTITYSDLNLSNEEIDYIKNSSILMKVEIPDVDQSVQYEFESNDEGLLVNKMERGILWLQGVKSIEIKKPTLEYYYSVNINIKIISNQTENHNLSIIGENNDAYFDFKIKEDGNISFFIENPEYKVQPIDEGMWIIIDHDLHFAITKQYISS